MPTSDAIQSDFTTLCKKLSDYLEEEQVAKIANAYFLADKAHVGQQRCSGEPYIIHPLAVAHILSDLHLDSASIVAALLHDVLEDTLVDKATIKSQFGEEVAELVDGVSKLDQIKFENRTDAQAENLRKMMLAMTRDLRVILIKLADRLHNMRTLEAVSPEKRRRTALETLEIYAPIASRLGMNIFRSEFEELGFIHLYPNRYRVLKEAVQKAKNQRQETIQLLENVLQEKLAKENISLLAISEPPIHLYSLYKKMKKKDIPLSEITDTYRLHVQVKTIEDCYRTLGVVHSLYKPVHGQFKDYIAIPKANGYQSLHTTVVGPSGLPIEIQIRTEIMHWIAENGFAANWLYQAQLGITDMEVRAQEWLKNMLDLQQNTGNAAEFIENLKIDLYPDEVYVFTPTGDILSLPTGATAVDFAYAVHSDVGDTCVAAKIDRRLVPLSTRLGSGQTVEVVTAEGAHPNPAWLSFVVTGKAKAHIRHWLKTQKESESRLLGERMLERALAALSLSLATIPEEQMKKVLEELHMEHIDRLFEEIGLGNQMAPLVAKRFLGALPLDQTMMCVTPLAIQGTEGMVVSYANCCRPIPGDEIVGFLSAGRGIVIHREICRNVAEMHRFPEKYIFLQWASDVVGDFQVEVRVEVFSKKGLLASLANVLAESDTNIESVHIDERDKRHSILTFLIHIHHRVHLARVLRRLRASDSVTRVMRVK